MPKALTARTRLDRAWALIREAQAIEIPPRITGGNNSRRSGAQQRRHSKIYRAEKLIVGLTVQRTAMARRATEDERREAAKLLRTIDTYPWRN